MAGWVAPIELGGSFKSAPSWGRLSSGKSRERPHACGKRGQHRAWTGKKALCGRATWHGDSTVRPPTCPFHRLTLLVSLSLTQSEFFLRQREDCVNLIKSLNLFQILTYEGSLWDHFPQWNCKLLATRTPAVTTPCSLATFCQLFRHLLSSWHRSPFKSNPHPTAFKNLHAILNQGLGESKSET